MHLQKLDKLLEVHIFMSKKGTQHQRYSTEFKIGVILDMREHRLSYFETVRKYELGNTRCGAAIALLQRWECIYFKGGRRSDSRKSTIVNGDRILMM